MSYLDELNKNQLKAVTASHGTYLIIAGPGTGKTKTLTSRIAYLIKKGEDPKNILAVTFTNRAANEMKERLLMLVDNKDKLPFVGTFHSIAFRLVSDIKNKKITIIDSDTQKRILKTIKKDLKLKGRIKDLELIVSRAKSKAQKPDIDSQKILTHYNLALKDKDLWDYEDLLIEANKMLGKRKYSKYKYKYIFVDEFQDTNSIQYEIVKKLLAGKNLFVIGDPKQSIYGFRGVDVNNFEQLKKDYPDYKEIVLDKNYRSTKPIIEVSELLFPGFPKLNTDKTDGNKVCLVSVANELSEARFIVKKISEFMGGLDLNEAGNYRNNVDETFNFSNFAVIYRTHRQAKVLESILVGSGIPYQIVGKSLYRGKEVDFMIKCLKYLYSLEKNEHPDDITISEKSTVEYLNILKTEAEKADVSNIVQKLIDDFKLIESVEEKPETKYKIQDFLLSAENFKGKGGLKLFLEHLDEAKENDYYDRKVDKITLLTIHASKGLEFKNVFLCGFEDGLIPKKLDNFEEEKRLLYVALTRASDNLYLTWTKKRWGQLSRVSSFEKILTKLLDKTNDLSFSRKMTRIKQMDLF